LLGYDIEFLCNPNFLLDTESNEILGIDAYDPISKVGLMYQPKYMYTYPSNYFKTETEFKDAVYDNELRLTLCDAAGVYLITIPYTVDLGDENNYVPSRVRKSKLRNYIISELDKIRVQHV